MVSVDDLIERLRLEEFSGLHTMGGGNITSDGKTEVWGGKKIMRLRNPDGLQAAEALTTLQSRVIELEERVRGIGNRASTMRKGTDDRFELVEFEAAATKALSNTANRGGIAK